MAAKLNHIEASLEQDNLTDKAHDLLKKAGHSDPVIAMAAQAEIANGVTEIMNEQFLNFGDTRQPLEAADTPLREGVLDGDIASPIFQSEDFTKTSDLMLPLDFLSPGTEKNFVAYVLPDHGKIPQRRVEADYLMLNVYPIGSSIDCTRRFFRNGRMDVLRRMIEVLEMSFVKKNNDDAWKTLLGAVQGRGIVTYDGDATAGQFTPKLVSIMKTVMRRNGGGNSSSINRRRLTDLYMSPEAFEDMTSWGLNLIPDDIRSQIHRSSDGNINGLYSVNFRDIDELGVGQEYQNYYSTTLSGSLGPNSDEELVVALDLSQRGKSFIRPVAEPMAIFEDNTLHREGLVGFYGLMEGGWAVLDVRYVLAGSF